MPDTTKADLQFFEQFEPDVFWHKHGQKIIWGLVAVAVVAFYVVYSQRQTAERETLAAGRLARATDPATLQQLAQDYKGAEIGAQALLRLADIQYQSDHIAEAAASYHDFIATYPQNPLVDTALYGQAVANEAQGKYDEAKTIYQQIVSRQTSYANVAAKIGLARCLVALKQKKEAAQYYEELLPAVANTPWEVEVAVPMAVLARNLDATETNPAAPAANVVQPFTAMPEATAPPVK